MQYTSVTNLRWANQEHTAIDCDVDFDGVGVAPFTANPNDTVGVGPDVFARAVSGEFGQIADYVAPPPPPVFIPTSVTMRQARLALLDANLLDSVDAAIAAIPDATQRRAAQIEWEFAATVDRSSPFTQQLAAGLGLTDTQLDSLFTQAAAL